MHSVVKILRTDLCHISAQINAYKNEFQNATASKIKI